MQIENIEGNLTPNLNRNTILIIKMLITAVFPDSNTFKLECTTKLIEHNKQDHSVTYFTLTYIPWEDYHFDFYSFGQGASNMYCKTTKIIDGNGNILTLKAESKNITIDEVMKNIEVFVKQIHQEETNRLNYKSLLEGEDSITDNGKIQSTEKHFSSKEFDLLDNKLNSILEFLFKTQDLSLEAINELKEIVEELKTNAKFQSKDKWQESFIGKVFKKGYETVEDKAYNASLGFLLSEIAKIFSGTKFSELGAGINNLLLKL
jgi:hypothetical protein